jgi:hypothetical protein
MWTFLVAGEDGLIAQAHRQQRRVLEHQQLTIGNINHIFAYHYYILGPIIMVKIIVKWLKTVHNCIFFATVC